MTLSSYICHGVGPIVDPFRSHVSRSLFKGLHNSFCQSGNSVSLPWVIYYEAFYSHVVSSLSCIPVICPELVLFLIPLQFVYLFCNLSTCILLFSYISSLLPLFFWHTAYTQCHNTCACMRVVLLQLCKIISKNGKAIKRHE